LRTSENFKKLFPDTNFNTKIPDMYRTSGRMATLLCREMNELQAHHCIALE